MKDWFASDHHFYHRNILQFCGRPFEGVDHMNRALINAHNEVVFPGDRVWFVGDFSFGEPGETSNVLSRMNGQKFLIKGNHDHQRRINGVEGYAGVFQYKELKFDNDHVILCHFPLLMWNRAHHGAYHLHGHCHGSMRYPPSLAASRIFDVGVDNLHNLLGSYSPISWEQIRERLEGNAFVALDHHESKP